MIETAQDHLYRIVDTTIPIIIFFLTFRRQAKKEQEARAEKVREELEQSRIRQDERHRQNQAKLNELLDERDYLVPHDHNEKGNQTLSAGGIIRRKKRNDR